MKLVVAAMALFSYAIPTILAAGDPAAGKDVFEGKCSDCHNADSTENKEGPGLKGVKNGKLPSGKKATPEAVLQIVNDGGMGMPPFKGELTDKDKQDVVAYVMTL